MGLLYDLQGKHMKKNKLTERFDRAVKLLESREEGLTMGTSEYEDFLEEIIQNLKTVKKTLRSRKHREHRKEADRIQSAINAMKYLSSKNRRILNNSVVQESSFSREAIRNFITKYR